jgi:hypothetical protein
VYLQMVVGKGSDLAGQIGWSTPYSILRSPVCVVDLRLLGAMDSHSQDLFWGIAAPWEGLIVGYKPRTDGERPLHDLFQQSDPSGFELNRLQGSAGSCEFFFERLQPKCSTLMVASYTELDGEDLLETKYISKQIIVGFNTQPMQDA